jgi:hypothetical protein
MLLEPHSNGAGVLSPAALSMGLGYQLAPYFAPTFDSLVPTGITPLLVPDALYAKGLVHNTKGAKKLSLAALFGSKVSIGVHKTTGLGADYALTPALAIGFATGLTYSVFANSLLGVLKGKDPTVTIPKLTAHMTFLLGRP